MRITNVEIENYRCFKHKILWSPHPELNILVGENNSGKSALFKLINQIHSIHVFNSDNFPEKEWSNFNSSKPMKIKFEYIIDKWVLEKLHDLKRSVNLPVNNIISFLFRNEKMTREIKYDGTPESIIWECRDNIKELISSIYQENYTKEDIELHLISIFQENSEQGFDIDEFSFTNSDSKYEILRELLFNLIFFSQTLTELKLQVEAEIIHGKKINPIIILGKISRNRDNWNYEATFKESEGITYLKMLQNSWFTDVESFLHNYLEKSLVNISEIRMRSNSTKGDSFASPDGLELNGVLYNLMMNKDIKLLKQYNEIQKEFQFFYPNNGFRVVEENGELSIQVKNNKTGKEFKLEDYGTGMMDILIIITNLIAFQGKIILIEEPETHIHPIFQRKLMSIIVNASRTNQIFITTHSPTFFSFLHVESVVCFYQNEISSFIFPFDINHLKDMKNKRFTENPCDINTIRSRYLKILTLDVKRAFFAKGVIIVEGETEKLSLPVWSKIFDFDLDKESIEIINCYSKFNIIDILELLQMYQIPVFVIFDLDDSGDKNHKMHNNWILKSLNCEFDLEQIEEGFIGKDICIFNPKYEVSLSKIDPKYKTIEADINKENKFHSKNGQKGLKAYYTAIKYHELELEPPLIIKNIIMAIKDFFIPHFSSQ